MQESNCLGEVIHFDGSEMLPDKCSVNLLVTG
jgi:hypothetical protein